MPTTRLEILQHLNDVLGEIAPIYIEGTVVLEETETPFLLFDLQNQDFELGSKDSIRSRVQPVITAVGENLLDREELIAQVLEAVGLIPVSCRTENSYRGKKPLYVARIEFQSFYLPYAFSSTGLSAFFVSALNDLRGPVSLEGAGTVHVITGDDGTITISGTPSIG